MKLSVKVDADLGNTETRVGVLYGKNKYRFNLSNQFIELDAGYSINSRYEKPSSNVIIVDSKDEQGELERSYVANGLIVEREFKTKAIRPSGLKLKTKQLTTLYTLNLIISRVYILIANEHKIPVETLDLAIDFKVLLPPSEHTTSSTVMETIIKGIKNVKMHSPVKLDKNVEITSVEIASEAVTGFISVFYKEVGIVPHPDNVKSSLYNGEYLKYTYKEDATIVEVVENEKFRNGYVIILDIGGGTTDLAIFKDLELVENSKETIKRGGNNVEADVKRKIKSVFGYVPDNIRELVQTCVLENGVELFDVSDIVTDSKETYTDATVQDILDYLETMNVPIQQVKGLLVSGGGATPSIYKGEVKSPAMSVVLEDFLRDYSPNIQTLNTGDRDLRSLNIEGSLIITKYQ